MCLIYCKSRGIIWICESGKEFLSPDLMQNKGCTLPSIQLNSHTPFLRYICFHFFIFSFLKQDEWKQLDLSVHSPGSRSSGAQYNLHIFLMSTTCRNWNLSVRSQYQLYTGLWPALPMLIQASGLWLKMLFQLQKPTHRESFLLHFCLGGTSPSNGQLEPGFMLSSLCPVSALCCSICLWI